MGSTSPTTGEVIKHCSQDGLTFRVAKAAQDFIAGKAKKSNIVVLTGSSEALSNLDFNRFRVRDRLCIMKSISTRTFLPQGNQLKPS